MGARGRQGLAGSEQTVLPAGHSSLPRLFQHLFSLQFFALFGVYVRAWTPYRLRPSWLRWTHMRVPMCACRVFVFVLCVCAQSEVTAVGGKMSWKRVAAGSVHLHTLYGGAGGGSPLAQGGQQEPGQQQAGNDAHATSNGCSGAGGGVLAVVGGGDGGRRGAQVAPLEAAPCGPLLPLLPRLAHSLVSQVFSAGSVWDVAAAAVMAGWTAVPRPELPACLQPVEQGEEEVGLGRGVVRL